jgi:hypothetical protein
MADSGNVWAATLNANGACIYVAPLGTPLPTTATEALDNAFIDLGWMSEDGFKNSIKRDTTKHYAFGGDVVKTTQDRYTETAGFALLETNADTLAVVYGTDNVTVAGNTTTVEHSSLMLDHQVFVFEYIDGDNVGRVVMRDAQVTELADVTYKHSDLKMFDLTVDLFKTDTGENAVYEVIDYAPGS